MTTPQLLTCASPSEQHIDRLTIEHLAALARIRLTADEQAAVAEHLHRMLSYIEKLREVNTEGIEPMAHAVDIVTSLRGDEVINPPNTEALLQTAPARIRDFFVVSRIIE